MCLGSSRSASTDRFLAKNIDPQPVFRDPSDTGQLSLLLL